MRGITADKTFYWGIVIVCLAGGILRFVNINYASLWGDELYSALLASPENSWYEVLYIQRAYQPPLYAFSLWVWVKIFTYNEFYIRLFTVLAGIASIGMSAALGKKIHSYRLGLVLAFIVAFSPVQIWYSLEARFYVFVYLFAAASLWLYWHILTAKRVPWWIYVLKVFTDAALCYFHHFGIIFVFTQFLYDAWLYLQTKKGAPFFKKCGGYFMSALLYLPWVVWGLSEAMKVKQYWLKEINIIDYLAFSFQYPAIINWLCILFIAYFLVKIFKSPGNYSLFPLIVVMVTLVPVLYSYIKMPMLVDRYAMVMAPAFYVMLGLGILFLFDDLASYKAKFSAAFMIVFALVFLLPGFYLSLINRQKLDKHPWREISNWLNSQPDIDETKIYSIGAYVKNKKDLDFYLKSKQTTYQVDAIQPGEEKKMYLVETGGYWKIKDSVLHRLDSFYTIQKHPIKAGSQTGNIYICTVK
jgi:mannosyltransferase